MTDEPYIDHWRQREEERREEERQYQADVFYEVWRSGGNPDNIDRDRVNDYYHDGMDEAAAASREMRRLYPPQPQFDEEEPDR